MMTVSKLLILTVLAGFAGNAIGAEMKAWPAAAEPNWKTWPMPTREIGEKVQASWKILRENRPDRKFETPEEAQAVGEKIQANYKILEENAVAACAVGAYYLQRTQDDWERLMIAGTLYGLDEEKAKPFLIWAMANSGNVELLFPAVFQDACYIAEQQKVEDLAGLQWILKTQKGAVYLPEYDWIIPTHDCLFFVFGRFGNQCLPYLRAALRDKDPYVRRNAAVVLGYFMDGASRDDLMALLKGGGIPSLGAAFALGEMRQKDAIPYVQKLLTSGDVNYRLWATYALFEIRDPATLPILEQALSVETDEAAKMELTAAIEHIKTNELEGVQPLSPAELAQLLKEAEESGSLELPFDRIEKSVTREHLPQIVHLRRLSIDDISDAGHQELKQWHKILKTAVHTQGTIR